MTREQALEMREALSAAAQYLSDSDSLRYAFLFPWWKENTNYSSGFKCRYNDKLYRAIENHTSSSLLTPTATLGSLFEEIV